MDNGHFESRFLSTEQDFIYNFGVNRGHTLSYLKINRCYFLSAEAKQLYHNICDYAWGDKRNCHPSQSILRLELGWSRSSMDKYMKELRESGLIHCESLGVNKPLLYHIAELRTVPCIVHSELIHRVKEELGVKPDDFYPAMAAYKKFIRSSNGHYNTYDADRIAPWFAHYFRERGIAGRTVSGATTADLRNKQELIATNNTVRVVPAQTAKGLSLLEKRNTKRVRTFLNGRYGRNRSMVKPHVVSGTNIGGGHEYDEIFGKRDER
ncbi:helix-turn-helix domain-containing protein [Paenibacillus sp. NPDC058071]|uniref:helix-turn-helix domain-containing protein n=1 Tax=Paenibacillus sp. NPDC058071 TaxID=3346326 RepID=UPI0036DB4E38